MDISSRYGFAFVWLECVPCSCGGESAVIVLSSHCEINMKCRELFQNAISHVAFFFRCLFDVVIDGIMELRRLKYC